MNPSRCYVEYYAYHPGENRLKRKIIKINQVADRAERRRYGRHLVDEINRRLYSGWNPFYDQATNLQHTALALALDAFEQNRYRQYAEDSVRTFRQRIGVFRQWCTRVGADHRAVSNFTTAQAHQFMDQLLTEKGISGRTFNNYRADLVTAFEFLRKRGYVPVNPFLQVDRMRNQPKKRRPLTTDERQRLKSYLVEHDRAFLIVCLLLFSCKIRRTEMTKLRIRDLDLTAGRITVPAYDDKGRNIAKSKRSRVVVIPDAVVPYFRSAGLDRYPSDHFLIGPDWVPSGKPVRWANRLTEHFRRIADGLGMEKYRVTLYSLKDTGIMDDLAAGIPLHAVRDQAGHSDAADTNKYLPPVPASLEIVRRRSGDL